MPAKGKHRRPKSPRFTRSIAVAGTGGAALALPFIGATGAHAAPSQSVSEKAVQALPVAGQKAAEKKEAAKKADVRTYSVKVGDYLSKIADEQNVEGGWKKLYADNREAVGDDPALIHPGLKLAIGGKAAPSAPKASAPSSSSSSDSTASKSTKTSKSSKSSKSSQSTASKTTAAAQSAGTTGTTNGFTAPVSGAAVGTAYKVAGSMWSSGYHTGVDFAVPTGTSLRRLGRRVRQPGRHPARRRPLRPVRPPVVPLGVERPVRHRGSAGRPLRLDRQLDRPAPALRDPRHPGLRLGPRPGRLPPLEGRRHRLTAVLPAPPE